MSDLHNFNAAEVEPVFGFEALPEGKYVAVITASEFKATKAGNGEYLELTFEVIEGEHKGRNLWARLNLTNPNRQTVKFAEGELSAICRAVGVLTPKDAMDLHNLPLVVSVKCKKREDNGEITNEIRGYTKKETPPDNPPDPEDNTPPWRRS